MQVPRTFDELAAKKVTGAVIAAVALREAGIGHCFGIPGVQNLALYEGLEACDVQNVLIANEESAPFAAAAIWQASRGTRVACVNVIGGPGITHALGGVAKALDERHGMLILTTGIKTGPAHRNRRYQLHDVDNIALLSPVCKAVFVPATGGDIASVLLDAVRLARTDPYGPVGVELPSDMLSSLHLFSPPEPAVKLLRKIEGLVVHQPPLVASGVLPQTHANSPATASGEGSLGSLERALWAISAAAPPESVICADAGRVSKACSQRLLGAHLLQRRKQQLLVPRRSECLMGNAVPAAIGAGLGTETPMAIALVDAPSLLLTGMELSTAKANIGALALAVVVVVEDKSFKGNGSENNGDPQIMAPYCSGHLPRDLGAFAESFDLPYVRVGSDLEQLEEALATAHAEMKSVVVELQVNDLNTYSLRAPLASGNNGNSPAGAAVIGAGLVHAGVRQVISCPGSAIFRRLVDSLATGGHHKGGSQLSVFLTTDDQSSGFVADGFGRTLGGREVSEEGRVAAVLMDGSAECLPQVFSGVGEAKMDGAPLLLVLLADMCEGGVGAGDAAMRIGSSLCKRTVHARSASAVDIASALRSGVCAALEGCHGPVIVQLPRKELLAARDNLCSDDDIFEDDIFDIDEPTIAPTSMEDGTFADDAFLDDELVDESAAENQLALTTLHSCKPLTKVGLMDPGMLQQIAHQVAQQLLDSKQPRLHLGLGAASDKAQGMLVALAEATGCVVSTTFSGKGSFPEDHPLSLGAAIGEAVPAPFRTIADGCDFWLIIGSQMGELSTAHYRLRVPKQNSVVHVDVDPNVPGANYAATAVVEDAEVFLNALRTAIGHRRRSVTADTVARLKAARRRHVRNVKAEADSVCASHSAISPHTMLSILQDELPASVTFTSDSGNGTVACAENLCMTIPRSILSPCNYSSMGYSVPAAIGACLAKGSISVAVVGDGAFLMTGGEIAAAASAKLPLIVVVLNDGELGMMSGLQRLGGRDPFCTLLPGYRPHQIANALGVSARCVRTREEMAAAVEWAQEHIKANLGPVLLDVSISYEFPSFYSRGVTAAPVPQPILRPQYRTGCNTSFASSELSKRVKHDDFNLWAILEHAHKNYPNQPAAVQGDVMLTFSDLYTRVCRVGTYMASNSICAGDVIACLAPNVHQVLEVHYAAIACRAAVLNLNYRLTASELAYILKDAAPVWIVVSTEFAQLLGDCVSQMDGKCTLRGVLWIEDSFGGKQIDVARSTAGSSIAGIVHRSYEMLMVTAGSPETPVPPLFTDTNGVPDLAAEIYYTSGTTGQPKGVVLTHKNVQLHALGCMVEHRLGSSDRWAHIAPIFHLVDAYAMFAIVWVGGVQIFVPKFSVKTTLEAIECNHATVTNLASTMIPMLLADPKLDERDLSSLSLVSCGGAPLNRATVIRAIEVFDCEFFLSYGMTECCGKISMSLLSKHARGLPASEQVNIVCSSGKPFSLIEMRLVGDSGVEVTEGEVQIRGDTVFSGYLNNPSATGNAFTSDGWFKTGDVARREDHGYITICDRKKDMILTGSENVFSVEVERALAEHPAVATACVFGVPSDLLGEEVVAYVVHYPGKAATANELRKFCYTLIADYKVPREIIVVGQSELPMTGSGKVSKNTLKQRHLSTKNVSHAGAMPESTDNDTYHIVLREDAIPYREHQCGECRSWLLIGGEPASNLSKTLLNEHTDVCVMNASSREADVSAITDVVYMAALDLVNKCAVEATEYLCSGLLWLLKQLIAKRQPCRLHCITKGALNSSEREGTSFSIAMAQQAIWGIIRVAQAEQPHLLQCRIIDLCPFDSGNGNEQTLQRELLAKSVNGSIINYECIWRRGKRFLPQLQMLPLPSSQLALKDNGCYIVTGGLGGLGQALVRRLIQWGARQIVLISRSKPQVSVTQSLDALQKQSNATIMVVQADCSLREEMHVTISDIESTSSILGIFHLAGVVGEDSLESLTWDGMQKVLKPKVDGSAILHQISVELELKLDYFVMFASVYGLLGYPKLADYAAANAAQIGLAAARKESGLPSLAVSWGTWSNAGMAHRFGSGFENYWRRTGMGFVDLDEGMQTLENLMVMSSTSNTLSHAAVLPADWAAYGKGRRSQPVHPLCTGLVGEATAEKADPERTDIIAMLQTLCPAEKITTLEAVVCEAIRDVMGNDEMDVMKNDELSELGLSSMLVVELMSSLSSLTGLDLSPILAYEAVTVSGLVKVVLEKLPVTDSALLQDLHDIKTVKERGASGIVVAGIGLRFPGRASTPQQFFANLVSSMDAIVDPATDRPHNGRPSGYLDTVSLKKFDRKAFGISEREAQYMDPQQRLLLEVVHEAIDDAGISLSSEEDRNIGVFVGISAVDYGSLTQNAIEAGNVDHSPYGGPAWSISIASNRISYALDLRGPSMSIDTACSSSLIATDAAAEAIRSGRCHTAVVCGANIQLREVWSNSFAAAGMLSPTFRCRFGADDADGYVRGEGIGCVVLCRSDLGFTLPTPYCKLEATATNQDGKSATLTAPNPASQELLLRECYARAGLDPTKVDYVEAHGTGTQLGDPIELAALGRVLGGANRVSPLLVGSVKSNIGHLECASGIASIIKAALILHNGGRVPPSLHCTTLNSFVDWGNGVEIAAATHKLNTPATIGVSGFGFGGSNGHIVLSSSCPEPTSPTTMRSPITSSIPEPRPVPNSSSSPCGEPMPNEPSPRFKRVVVPVVAHSTPSMCETARRLAVFLKGHPESGLNVADVSLSMTTRITATSQTARAHRSAVIASNVDELVSKLTDVANGNAEFKSVQQSDAKVCFVFTGQGSQYVKMGHSLYQSHTVFRDAMDHCGDILRSQGWDLCGTLYSSDESVAAAALQDAQFVQPALLALEYSLSELVCSWGLQPHCCMGHSLGEITSMVIAGVLSLKDGLALVSARGRAFSSLPRGEGGMAAVELSESEALHLIHSMPTSTLCIAAVNGPCSCVLSGPKSAIADAVTVVKALGKRAKQLDVLHAYHSHLVQPAMPELLAAAEKLAIKGNRDWNCNLISNVTGEIVREIVPSYFVDHALNRVDFARGVETAAKDCNILLEIGPSPHLSVHLLSIAQQMPMPVSVVPTLRPNYDDEAQMLNSFASLFVAGAPDLNWTTQTTGGRRIRVPPTAMVGEMYWLDGLGTEVSAPLSPSSAASRHPGDHALWTTQWNKIPCPATVDAPIKSVLTVGLTKDLAALLSQKSSFLDVVSLDEPSKSKIASALGKRWGLVVVGGQSANLLHVLKFLCESSSDHCDRVAVLTAGVYGDQPTDTVDESAITTAGLWGFAKSARLETPSLRLACIDIGIDSMGSPDSALLLANALHSQDFGTENLRITADGIICERMVLLPVPASPTLSAGLLVITGGTGALGLQIAARFVSRSKTTGVILLSRSGKVRSENQVLWEDLIRATTESAVNVEVVCCDCSSKKSVESFINTNKERLRGCHLLHAAGILDDGLLVRQTEKRISAVMAAKIGSALILHHALLKARVEPDTLVLFSSVTSLTGNIGQVSYGSANAQLDAFARQRRRCGLPAVAIQWGPWANFGMAVDTYKHQGAESLWKPLDAEIGFEIFSAVSSPSLPPVCCISQFHWNGFSEQLVTNGSSATRKLLSRVMPEMIVKPPREAEELNVCNVIKKLLKDDSIWISNETPLRELGLDSMDLSALAQMLACPGLSVVTLMGCKTVGDIIAITHSNKSLRQKSTTDTASTSSMPVSSTRSDEQATVASPVTLEQVLSVLSKYNTGGTTLAATSNLVNLGLDSMDMSGLAVDLSRAFGVQFTSLEIMSCRSAAQITDALQTKVRVAHNVTAKSTHRAKKGIMVSTEITQEQVISVLNRYTKDGTTLSPNSDLVSLGLDSIDMSGVALDLSRTFGVRLTSLDIMSCSSVSQVTGALQTNAPVTQKLSALSLSSDDSTKEEAACTLDDITSHAKILERTTNQMLQMRATGSIKQMVFIMARHLMQGLSVGAVILLTFLILQPLTRIINAFDLPMTGGCNGGMYNGIIGYNTPGLAIHEFITMKALAEMFLLCVESLCIAVCVLLLWSIIIKWSVLQRNRTDNFQAWSWNQLRRVMVEDAVGMCMVFLGLAFQDTQLITWYYRLLGAKIGQNVFLGGDLILQDHDLIHIGDHVTIEHRARLDATETVDGLNFVSRPIVIGNSCRILASSSVRLGTQLGDGVTVTPRSTAQGDIRAGSTVCEEHVYGPGIVLPTPSVNVQTHLRTAVVSWQHILVQFVAALCIIIHVALAASVGLTLIIWALWLVPGILRSPSSSLQPIVTIDGICVHMNVAGALMIVASLLVMGFCLALQALLVKWLLVGKVKEGTHRISTMLVMRHWYVARLVGLSHNLISSYFQMTLLLWLFDRALGANIAFDSVPSPIALWTPDLVKVEKGAYISSNTLIACVEISPDCRTVSFRQTIIGARSFVGACAFLLPGSSLEPESCVSSMSLVPSGSTVATHTTHLGCSDKITLGYRPEFSLSSAPGCTYHVLNLMFCLYFVAIGLLLRLTRLAIILATLWVLIEHTALSNFEAGNYALGAMIGTVLGLAIGYLIITPLVILIGVAHKWLLLGRVREGTTFPQCGWMHVRWILSLRFSRLLYSHLRHFGGTELLCTVGRMMGAKIGRFVVMDILNVGGHGTEVDLVEVGDACYLGRLAIYAHDFSRGQFSYKGVKIGKGVRVCTPGQVVITVPDTEIAPGSTLGPGCFILPGKHNAGVNLCLLGNPARPCERTGNGLWLHEDLLNIM